jgi:hypothetical protein
VEFKVPDPSSSIFDPNSMKLFACAALAVSAATAFAQDPEENHHDVSVFFGKSAILLGSSDIRYGGGLSVSYGRYEPRFSSRFASAQLMYEGYLDNTRGNGESAPIDISYALGGLAYMRWVPRMSKSVPRPYFDFGWGFQYASRPTHDLPSEINSTPFGDLGIAIPAGPDEVLLGVRFLHISNAGLVRPNRGQDELFLIATLTY